MTVQLVYSVRYKFIVATGCRSFEAKIKGGFQ